MKNLFTLVVILFSLNALFSQCNTSNLQWTFNACSNGTYFAQLDFDHPNPNQTFYLTTNYTYQSFQVSDLPITVGPLPGYCTGPDLQYQMSSVINNNTCQFSGTTPYQCCNNLACEIEIISVDYTYCESGSSGLVVFFEEFGCYPTIDYVVTVYKKLNGVIVNSFASNGDYYSGLEDNYLYVELPEAIDCTYEYEIEVKDLATGSSSLIDVPEYCCNCDVSTFTATPLPNTCDDVAIEIAFDFTANVNFGNQGYTVSDGNTTQTYLMTDPKIFNGVSNCFGSTTLTITDMAQPNCEKIIEVQNVCCACNVEDFLIATNACNNGSFDLYATFTPEGECGIGTWYLTANTINYQMTFIGNNTYAANNIVSQDSIINVSICSDFTGVYCIQAAVLNPCYVVPTNTDTCLITSFIVSNNYNCSGEMGNFTFDFNGQDFGINGYSVQYAGTTTSYTLNDPRIAGGIASCDSNLVIKIVDNNHPQCMAEAIAPALCCPCIVDSIHVSVGPCIQGSFSTNIFLNVTGGSCINGNWTVSIGNNTYPLTGTYADLQAIGLMSGDSLVVLSICSEYGDCYLDTIVNPCFNTVPTPCNLTAFNLIPSGNCQGGFMLNSFSFTGSNFGASGYKITDGLNTYSFQLGEPLYIDCPAVCNGSTIYTITDNADVNCTLMDTVNLCCPCTYDSLDVSTSVCDFANNTFNLNVQFTGLNGFCSVGPWTFSTQDTTIGLYPNGSGNYFFNGLTSNDSLLFISLCTAVGPSYCVLDTIANPCYVPITTGNSKCVLTNMNVKINKNNGLEAKIDIENNNKCGIDYNVSVNNEFIGQFKFYENLYFLPLTNTNLPSYLIKVCNAKEENVCLEKNAENPYFISSSGDLFNDVKMQYNNGNWFVENNTKSSLTFQITDLLGRSLFSRRLIDHQNNVQFQPIAGLYLAKLTNEKGQHKIWKIIVAAGK
jgi:hypothetical protein